MMDAKKKSKMHPMEQKAKMSVLDDLSKMADDAMGGKLAGMSKVTVAADDKDGLEEGLSKAKSLLGSLPKAFDDSHPDHENFTADEAHDDGDDGMDAYPDSDDDHGLELDPKAAHEEDEEAEHGKMMAEGGEVSDDDMSDEDDSSQDSEMPSDEELQRIMKLLASHPHLFQK